MLESKRMKIKEKVEKLVQLVDKMRCSDDPHQQTSTKAPMETVVSAATLSVRCKKVHKLDLNYPELMLIKTTQMK
jgi:tetrahydromethanopterin S-methyltransferase subunit B